MDVDYDLFVIGAGSGGVRAARLSAQLGAKVAIAEERYLGGTCVNVGCVPKKLFVYASEYSESFHDARGFGWNHQENSQFHWPTLKSNKDVEINRLNSIYGNLLKDSGVELIEGRAMIVDPRHVQVGSQVYCCKYILIATGGWPYVPNFPGNELVITSNEAFHLEELPKSIVIVGGGYIAVEFAGIFHGLGVETHLVYRGDIFLRGFDLDLRTNLKTAMSARGIKLHFGRNVEKIILNGAQYEVTLDDGCRLLTGKVMYATGRKPLTAELGLENTGVTLTDNGAIKVNSYFETSEPGIYALGDVTGKLALTPIAIREAICLANNLFSNENRQAMDYSNIPTAVFSQPTIGTVGLTEEQARGQFSEIRVFKSEFRALKNTLSGNSEKTFMKLIVDAATDRVIGCHMLGEGAGEIIQGIAIAIKAGATKQDFDNTVGIHPTSAEEFVTMRDSS